MTISLFYKQTEVRDYSATNVDFEKEVLLSTGGDEDGHPGVQIWLEGGDVGVLVSTGDKTWKVTASGQRSKPGIWTNIGFRWHDVQFKDTSDFMSRVQKESLHDLGGIQLMMDMKPIAHSLQPQEVGCRVQSEDEECEKKDVDSDDIESSDIPELMLGCHKTNASEILRDFAGGAFDEVAIFERFLNDSEKYLFFGGYSKY